jgi:hypothetical protein
MSLAPNLDLSGSLPAAFAIVILVLLVVYLYLRNKSTSSAITSIGQTPDAKVNPLDVIRAEMVKEGIVTESDATRLITHSSVRELMSLPEMDVDIVGEYGQVLELVDRPLKPISKLPYPKEVIRQALERLIQRTHDAQYKNSLQVGLLCLDDFIPDEQVPEDLEENQMQWLMRRFKQKNSA